MIMENFLRFGRILTKQEQKSITGGGSCTWTCVDGSDLCSSMQAINFPGSTPESLQALADSMCWDHDECLDVNCTGHN